MKAIKIDVEKTKHCIDAYTDEHNKNPYLIMSKKTKELLPPTLSYSCSSISCGDVYISSSSSSSDPVDIVINGIKYIPEDKIEEHGTWYGCKILIDDKLELGEVRMG